MTTYTDEQITIWLRGLLTIAWADGDFSTQEQQLITALTENELTPNLDLSNLQPILPDELATVIGSDKQIAENFLRTAVMVALADGIYSEIEEQILREYYQVLQINPEVLDALGHTKVREELNYSVDSLSIKSPNGIDVLLPVRNWLDGLEIHDPRLAHFLCKLIPPQCPFERDITLFGHKIVHIPPLCKLNPLYDQTVGLRFRALSYLADDCGEDVSKYC